MTRLQQQHVSGQTGPQVKLYPSTQKGNVSDDFFGVKVADPYRWLEDDRSAETKEWLFKLYHTDHPASINVESGKSASFIIKPDVKFNPDEYESKQVFYTSKTGTKVPMDHYPQKGIEAGRLTPGFSVATATWLANGGVYAVPNLRGGGEYAEYLQQNKYTSPEYTALSGGSNGGLLVGATMTINPHVAKVALPAVGVLDMLRYHTFTAGAGWGYDYGTANDSKEMFEYLKGYSPVHNVKEGVCYLPH
ncbi:hypothetical protein FQR65_LT15777 [Abscondita terminalis]|nr:hypothetical protein FQR65_LT15777 [Abscondita terminalis]